MENQAPSPEQAAEKALSYFKSRANPEKAAQAQKYFKERIQSYGFTASQLRQAVGEFLSAVKGKWGIEEIIRFCEIMLPNPYLEAKSLASMLLSGFHSLYTRELFGKVKAWLESNSCDNWASVDTLCPQVVGALLKKYPDLVDEIATWSSSPNRWVRRASLVSFIKLAKDTSFHNAIYSIADSLLDDSDDLVQKANGWLLRESGKADPERLKSFLLSRGPSVPRTTLRYAIERFDGKTRKFLLKSTRSEKKSICKVRRQN